PFPRGRRDGLPAFQLAASLLDMDVVTNAGDPRGAVLSAISSAKPGRRLGTRHARRAGITMACGLVATPGQPPVFGRAGRGGAAAVRLLGPRRLHRADRGLPRPPPDDADLPERSDSLRPKGGGMDQGEPRPSAARRLRTSPERAAADAGPRGPLFGKLALAR